MTKKKLFHLEHWQKIALLLCCYDIVTIAISYFLALFIRFDFVYSNIPKQYLDIYFKSIPLYIVLCIIVYYLLRMYRFIWRFVSVRESIRVILAAAITFCLNLIMTWSLFGRMPWAYHVFGIVLQLFFSLSIRLSYRLFLALGSGRQTEEQDVYHKRVMIIGAGNSGQALLRDTRTHEETSEHVQCFIDDNPNKWNRYVDGIPVIGGRNLIKDACEKYHIDKIYIAIPSATAEQKKAILNICNETGCELKNLPGMYQFMTGEITVSAMKEVSIEDLLGRDPIQTDLSQVFDLICGKVILVTGGGGSIGSELCRQIAEHQPRQLIILDIYENSTYAVQLELRRKYSELDLQVVIGSVRDSRKLLQVFETYRPQIVYHAAAHKHVPLMEDNPCEAIKNNAIGTYKTAICAMAYGCERFILISTDKAVNPTNIMGASKRMCEMIIQAFDYLIKTGATGKIPLLYTHEILIPGMSAAASVREALSNSRTELAAVRFGNVLGSNGSVIPLFKEQIANGGPVTVTHPDIIRYFMTIPEAVSLVLQAGAYAKGGEIFVLDMGEPVKIVDLARNLIRLSGHKPDEDIKIIYTGLRPGEKLYEEKLMAEEGLRKTENELIHIGIPIPFEIDEFLKQLEELMNVAYRNQEDIRDYVQKMVSTYHPA